MPSSSSYRISSATRERLGAVAAREGVTATALLERLILEGTEVLDYPGIVFRGPLHDRRAALAAGPDVWELVARLRELTGSEEERVRLLAEETGLHARLIGLALDYAAEHPADVRARIEQNRLVAERSRSAVRNRAQLLA